MRTVYLNGEYILESEAKISPFDRGFLFGDAIYEVTSVLDGKLVSFDPHMVRLQKSLGAIGMQMPPTEDEILAMHRNLVERNGIIEGLVYLQISRGAADRDFAFPASDVSQTVFAMTQERALVESPMAARGVKVMSVEDKRWEMCDVKTVQLLYASMSKVKAKENGADDAWFVRDGLVTEGTSNNAFIITDENKVVSHALDHLVLHGITRQTILACLDRMGLELEERSFSISEAQNAKEAFLSSSGTFVMPVIEIDGVQIGGGSPGPIVQQIRQAYIEAVRAEAI